MKRHVLHHVKSFCELDVFIKCAYGPHIVLVAMTNLRHQGVSETQHSDKE